MRLSKRGQEPEELMNRLFVYGSLMRGMERAAFINNPDKAKFLASATASGILYDLGSFPGMIESNNGSLVYGELYEIFDPEAFFETLDLIEGYWPVQPERSLYIRKPIQVTTETGATPAWSYVLNLPVDELEKVGWEVVGGNYRRVGERESG